MKKSLTFWNTFPAFLIIVGILWFISLGLIKKKRREQGEVIEAEPEPTAEEEEAPETREQRIITNYKVIRDALPSSISDVTAKILTAQAMHETGIFTSRLYIENNNLFGMRQPTARESLSLGGVDGWSNFATLENSVGDLLLYFKEFGLKPTWKEPNVYVKQIREKGYFTDLYINYFNAVRSHLATVKNLIQ